MQQQEMFFCEDCGAANPLGAGTHCFACSKPLPWSQSQTTQAAVRLNEVAIGHGTSVFMLAEPEEVHVSAPLQRTLSAGDVLNGRYEILAQVGQGGFGIVYKARDRKKRNRLVAVKQIRVDHLSARDLAEVTDSYNREVSLHSPLRHRNLPRVYDHFTDAKSWYLVMTYITGESLEAYLKRKAGGKLRRREALSIAAQLCDVLYYLHTRKPSIIFRDLKPANIMRTRTGRLYLIDFGIARRYQSGKTKDTVPFGSRGYAPPEQYGLSQTTPRSDLYSLGATLQTLLTGLDSEQLEHEDPELAQAKQQSSRMLLPQNMQALLDDLLTWEPHQRPKNAKIVKERLLTIRDGWMRPIMQTSLGILRGSFVSILPFLLYVAMIPFHLTIMISLVCPLLMLVTLLTGLTLLLFGRTRLFGVGMVLGVGLFVLLLFLIHLLPPLLVI